MENSKVSGTGANPYHFNLNTSLKVFSMDNNTNPLRNFTNVNSNVINHSISIKNTNDTQKQINQVYKTW